MSVSGSGGGKKYIVYVHTFTGLPQLWIETKDRTPITSKEEYLDATFRLYEDVVTRAPGDTLSCNVKIKGRGNSSWKSMPKKSYRLKFDEKVSILGEPSDKAWVLIGNWADKTTLRNQTAFFMGQLSNLEWTPKFHFVELFLNGRFEGCYQLGEKIKISKHRVNVGDDGFLMEIDSQAPYTEGSRYFSVSHLIKCVNIKEPDVEYGDNNFIYCKDFVQKADSVLFSEGFCNPKNGWKSYMDMDSFVDWYLINEITKNGDAILWTSCYLYLKRGGKLKMGPIWDFDIAFGNSWSNEPLPEGFYVKEASWFARMFEDPEFVVKVKERYEYFYSCQDLIMTYINENAQYLKYSVLENENRWGTLYQDVYYNYDIWGGYLNEVQYMKRWLKNRMDWLQSEFKKM